MAASAFLVGAALLLRGALSGWEFTTDDAYITLRYARNLYDGAGITWNAGEDPAVEGYSNFTYVLLGALALHLGIDPVSTLKWAGVAGLLVGYISTWFVARTFVSTVLACIPGLFIVSYIGILYWAPSGLETGLYLGLTLASFAFWCWSTYPPKPSGISRDILRNVAYSIAAICAFTRPEGLLLAIFYAIAAWEGSLKKTTLAHLPPLLALGAAFGAYLLWKQFHFGSLIPHSAKCKALYTGDPLTLVRDYWSIAFFWIIANFVNPRLFDRRHVVLLGYPLAYGILLIGVDPIIGHLNRHALTPWAFLVIGGSVAVLRMVDRVVLPRLAPSTRNRSCILLCSLGMLWSFHNVRDHIPRLHREAAHYNERMNARESLGKWLNAHLGPSDWVAIGDCGIVPFITHAKVLDLFCLNSLEISSAPAGFQPRQVADLVFREKPAAIVMHSSLRTPLTPRPEYGIYPEIYRREQLNLEYEHVATFGAKRDDFHYWVYLRREHHAQAQ